LTNAENFHTAMWVSNTAHSTVLTIIISNQVGKCFVNKKLFFSNT